VNDASEQVPDVADVREVMGLLNGLFDRVRRLPPGQERDVAFEQMKDFQLRLGIILASLGRQRRARNRSVMPARFSSTITSTCIPYI
jgi:hypothetical protein